MKFFYLFLLLQLIFNVPGYCPARGRGAIPLGAEVLSSSGQRCCPVRGGDSDSTVRMPDTSNEGMTHTRIFIAP